ncbi:MAG: C4-type zinc ribbon domain-containing protein [Puniceicoccales bacterium]|jgi:predicted  nucleic acid-binding Zn-ribbon protein|nr:C4-type zinc ribbon domain-containing protein [Puniceicoccales bacterium]
MDEKLPFLLTLQEYEQRRNRIDLRAPEQRRLQLEEQSHELREGLAQARQELLRGQRQITGAERELEEREEELRQCLGQQALSKKPEAFQALGAKIAQLREKISQSEDSILQELEAQEEKKRDFARLEEETLERIASLEKEIMAQEALLAESEEALRVLEEKIKTFRESIVDAECLSLYDQVRARGVGFPWIVAVAEHRCQGCHIRLSPEQEVFFHQNPHSYSFCEQCGRLLHRPSSRAGTEDGEVEADSA